MIDVQSEAAKTPFAIDSVGILNLDYPIAVRDQDGAAQMTTARWRMGVALPAERRGTHMSRFVAELEAHQGRPLDLDAHFAFARHLAARLDAEACDLAATFTWYRVVEAPVSGLASRLASTVTFGAVTGDRAEKTLAVSVAAKSLCPCSKAISDRGAHNQRSDVAVELGFAPDARPLAIDQVLALLERSASSPVYPLLKREDEKHVTEGAYDNPVFVEDLARNVASRLFDLPAVARFTVEAVNRESIHAHDCYARIRWKR